MVGGVSKSEKGWVRAYFWRSGLSGLPFYFLGAYLVRKKSSSSSVIIRHGALDSLRHIYLANK
jgi:hypothetical protein